MSILSTQWMRKHLEARGSLRAPKLDNIIFCYFTHTLCSWHSWSERTVFIPIWNAVPQLPCCLQTELGAPTCVVFLGMPPSQWVITLHSHRWFTCPSHTWFCVFSSLHPQSITECLAHTGSTINICSMSQWKNVWPWTRLVWGEGWVWGVGTVVGS